MIVANFVLTIPNIVFAILSFIVLWIVVSVPVWLAGKVMTGGKATFGQALLATLAGPIIYFLVAFIIDLFLAAVLGSGAFIIASILALIAWIWVYKASFHTGWLRAILIAVLAWIILVIMSLILGILFGVAYPSPFFPTI